MAPFVSLQSIGYRVYGDLLIIVALVRWAVYKKYNQHNMFKISLGLYYTKTPTNSLRG